MLTGTDVVQELVKSSLERQSYGKSGLERSDFAQNYEEASVCPSNNGSPNQRHSGNQMGEVEVGRCSLKVGRRVSKAAIWKSGG